MNLSRRELQLGMATALVVLGALTYVIGDKKYMEWKALRMTRGTLEITQKKNLRTLNKRDPLLQQLGELMHKLPAHPRERDVTSELLRQMQALSLQSGLSLASMKPDREEKVGNLDLYEMAITCQWDGNDEQLIKFLYQLQSQGAVMDIRQLVVRPESRSPGRLKGSFVVDCAYNRVDVAAPPVDAVAPPAEDQKLTVTPVAPTPPEAPAEAAEKAETDKETPAPPAPTP